MFVTICTDSQQTQQPPGGAALFTWGAAEAAELTCSMLASQL